MVNGLEKILNNIIGKYQQLKFKVEKLKPFFSDCTNFIKHRTIMLTQQRNQ